MDAQPDDHLGMTDAQWAWFEAHTHGYGEQDASGVDISLLRENLKLTPLQRLHKLERELRSLRDLAWRKTRTS